MRVATSPTLLASVLPAAAPHGGPDGRGAAAVATAAGTPVGAGERAAPVPCAEAPQPANSIVNSVTDRHASARRTTPDYPARCAADRSSCHTAWHRRPPRAPPRAAGARRPS